ncbi:nucleotidyltransferase family protein [Roseateles sp. DB2]|uniref:nucleotidyltransferase family protein n=1 Tax=Roseateles sp. DB2 TaxID=3453717 RepID=UPI003EEA6AAF
MSAPPLIPLVQARQAQVAELCRRNHARRLHLFGSATRADFRPADSDLDFLVEFDTSLPPKAYSDAFFALKTALELLFKRPVDLLTPEALRNPYLRQRVEAERVLVYGA